MNFVMWDVISWAIGPTDTHRKQFHRLPRFQYETRGISLFQANWNTHTGWRFQDVSYKPPQSQHTPDSAQFQGGAPPMIILNAPGRDFGKYSQGHDRIQKSLESLSGISHTAQEHLQNETTMSKTKLYSAFSSVWFETRANFKQGAQDGA